MDVVPGSTADTLEYFHDLLDTHFHVLHERRAKLDPPAPVYALEHCLSGKDVALLEDAVRAAYATGSLARTSNRWWLPFAVHAAEVGYIYDGAEYWPIYAKMTPSWRDSQHERDRVRGWLRKFSREYGGAIPRGPWANTFNKIAWPITHAVLPRYLQVQLARMLSDHRSTWPTLLDDPEALGVRLHSWSRHYSDRMEKFCQNTALVGHVATALLLSEEDEDSPYIESSTLDRLVESLNSERQSRRWLQEARRSASIVRARNFRRSTGAEGRGAKEGPRPLAQTDPKLQLRCEQGVWKAFAALPNLRPLQDILPSVYDEMRRSRAVVTGTRQVIPTGGLLFATAPVEFTSWPWPTEAFIKLQRASREVNLLIADQCRITSGPWWVFRLKSDLPALEVNGKFVRPGGHYIIVGASGIARPDVAWCSRVAIAVEEVVAYELRVPSVISETDSKALVGAGVSVASEVTIRPVGLVASAWDGEGSAEWLAGEPVLICIHAAHSPVKARLMLDGEQYFVDWPTGESEICLSLDGLAVGTHQIAVSLGDPEGDGRTIEGTLVAAIRDRQILPQGRTLGEGIRVRTEPAKPSLPELWDGHALVEVDGPSGATAGLEVTLRDCENSRLATHQKGIRLPVTGDDWLRLMSDLRSVPQLYKHYDECDAIELRFAHNGIGFATLTCERGFRGLRWVVSARHRDGGYAARLIDRTDGDPVAVVFFPMAHPLCGEQYPQETVVVEQSCGGLVWATNGEQEALQVIPSDPNQLLGSDSVRPDVSTSQRSVSEATKLVLHHRQWRDAELPAHPVAGYERERVLEAITSAFVSMLAPGKWADYEHQVLASAKGDVDLDLAQVLVGESAAHRAVAAVIARSLWQWNSSDELVYGLGQALESLFARAGITDSVKGTRFVLQATSSPGALLDWDETERTRYMQRVFANPVLARAARFAVLGTGDEVLLGGIG
ncbi:hypothetical protein QSJ19_17410 [Gordonia sp. ABSL11-1]|uniref:hypothetical protein n=1 Tax=Gordonia sp. ABSL11-1 TaxID=3053924 RepID=UPI002573D316|nr:hypothetical protein [Gordonia sp. ABSL11-1]MDL9947323.1 hypothetical protein [Gordonia sp. ABSL11-1]